MKAVESAIWPALGVALGVFAYTCMCVAGMGSITLKCNSLHYNYFGKMCHYITLQLLYFVNVINYITITLSK